MLAGVRGVSVHASRGVWCELLSMLAGVRGVSVCPC